MRTVPFLFLKSRPNWKCTFALNHIKVSRKENTNLKCYLKAVICVAHGALNVRGGITTRAARESQSSSLGLVFNCSPHCQINEALVEEAVVATANKKQVSVLSLKDVTWSRQLIRCEHSDGWMQWFQFAAHCVHPWQIMQIEIHFLSSKWESFQTWYFSMNATFVWPFQQLVEKEVLDFTICCHFNGPSDQHGP